MPILFLATGNAAQAIEVLKKASPIGDQNLAASAEHLVKKAQSIDGHCGRTG